MRLRLTGTAIFLTLSFTATSALADLIGSDVTATEYYPDTSTVYSCCGISPGPIGPVTVGPGVEFPAGSVAPDGQLDITGSQIIWTATETVDYLPGSFNGFELVFSGAPLITDVTVDASSTLPAASISFTGNEAWLNLEGESAVAGQQTILDVQTVPEPLLALPLGAVLMTLVLLSRKRPNRKLLSAVFALVLGCASLQAADRILVASSRSNSLEEFDSNGNWLRTFATTGPYAPVALAQMPTTGEIFVTTMWASGPSAGQLTNKILRYGPNGDFYVDWDTFTVTCDSCATTATQSLVFDPSGNLWVATAYGEDLGSPIYIFEYLAKDLAQPNPPAQPNPIAAPMFRGNQMAFNKAGNLCIAGFIDQDVQCFDTSSGKQTVDYYTEIHAASVSPAIQPAGLAFGGDGRMYLTSVFGGQVLAETSPGVSIGLLASLTSAPNELSGNLLLRGPCAKYPCLITGSAASHIDLYTSAFNTAPPTFSTPDPVYKISLTSGASDFIFEASPPALGNDHIWGAYWMIFLSSPSPILLFPY